MAPTLDVIILFSGDGDFIPLIQYLQALGKRVEVVGFSETTSSKLKEMADKFIDISENPSAFLIPINKSQSNSKGKSKNKK